MTAGAPTPRARHDRGARFLASMSKNSNKERGEKRGVLGTGRAKQLDKTRDADADAADDED